MKILIISYYYKHKNAMASVRAVKLAKYLAEEKNCQVTVLTSNQVDTWTKQYLTPVPSEKIGEWYAEETKRWTLIRKVMSHRREAGRKKLSAQAETPKRETPALHKPKKLSLKAKLISYLRWRYYFTIAKQEDSCLFKGLKKEYKRQRSPYFDAVIATSPTFGALKMGMWLRRHGHCGKLIADFRDPLYNPGFREKRAEARHDRKCLKTVVDTADEMVCVSRGIAQGILQEFPKKSRGKLHVITNGFDRDDVTANDVPVDLEAGKFHFVYTGTLYHGKRCVDMLAQSLKRLAKRGEISLEDCRLQYAGPDFGELLCQLGSYGLESMARDHGFVSREMSIALQKQADALLLLTWNERAYQGVIPGKLFEYMAMGRPIIALVTGDVADSEVKKLLEETGAGQSCEEATPEDGKKLDDYLLSLMRGEKRDEGSAQSYDYAEISKRYLELIGKG